MGVKSENKFKSLEQLQQNKWRYVQGQFMHMLWRKHRRSMYI